MVQSLKKTRESRNKYCAYNTFHIEEITRLDKIIGQFLYFEQYYFVDVKMTN